MRYILFLILFILPQLFYAQDTIFINNKGFEGEPTMGGLKYFDPPGWTSVQANGFYNGIDIHSADSRIWDVDHKPYEGNTYLGMVTRADGSYEMFSQVLKSPLQKDSMYQFSIHLSMAKEHNSPTVKTTYGEIESFVKPICVQLWGFDKNYKEKELLSTSKSAINHFEWRKYSFILSPKKDWDVFLIRCLHCYKGSEPYNGHILLDKASDLIKIKKQSE